ncbi:hypothetical protein [Caballeronia calidae]|uniref:hypothetical protein n=1 Tax=Caballeronia calidae TaxID=1777139 RepID=UPI0007895A90|nr:hypothetical protein [Caballeronia calidae]
MGNEKANRFSEEVVFLQEPEVIQIANTFSSGDLAPIIKFAKKADGKITEKSFWKDLLLEGAKRIQPQLLAQKDDAIVDYINLVNDKTRDWSSDEKAALLKQIHLVQGQRSVWTFGFLKNSPEYKEFKKRDAYSGFKKMKTMLHG